MKFSEERHIYTVKNRITEHLKIDEALYPPALKQPRHTHLFASFSFVSSGSYLENFGKKTYSRQPSTVIFHPPHESHAVDYESGVRILSVQISFEKLACIRRQSIILDSPMSCRTETAGWLGMRLGRELRRVDAASVLAIEGLALEMLAEASRSRISSEKDFPRWLKEAKDFLHDNFAESFALETVANIAGVHPAHLSRVFREKFGCTVGEYVRRLRVEFACRQISTTEMSLGEIASSAGFSDQSHFNKIFKNFFNLTPYEYRKISRAR
jgi:AraC family transcriptional regulator